MSKKNEIVKRISTSLKAGDVVMVIAGGSGQKRINKGKTGKIIGFSGKAKDRVIVEGLNFTKRHIKPTAQKAGGVVVKEAGIHISNVMYYVEDLKKPVRLKSSLSADGKKIRGYLHPETKQFVAI